MRDLPTVWNSGFPDGSLDKPQKKIDNTIVTKIPVCSVFSISLNIFEHKTRPCGNHLGGLRSVGWCGMLIVTLPINGKRLVPLTKSGALLGPLILRKGG